jgi:hypothetical protein
MAPKGADKKKKKKDPTCVGEFVKKKIVYSERSWLPNWAVLPHLI